MSVLEGISRRRSSRRLGVILAASGFILLLGLKGWLGPVKGLADWTINPVGRWFGRAGAGVGGFTHLVSQIGSLSADNQRLAAENADLRTRLAEDAELRQQNDALRKQLSFGVATSQQLIPAEVEAYQPDNFRQFITIRRGSADGIKEGMAVTAEGALVGRITEVGQHDAKVFMVTDPTFRVNALDQEADSRAGGTVHGQIGSGLVMEKIAQSDSVKQGDTIITSGLGGELPKGIIIGQVESVNRSDNAVFQTAQIVSPLKFSRLELVFVLRSSS